MLDVNFIPQVVRQCDDILKELKKFSVTFKIDMNFIDFEILNIFTILSYTDGKTEVLNNDTMHLLEDDDKYNKEGFDITQKFDIKIIPKVESLDIALKFSHDNDEALLYFYQEKTLQEDEDSINKILRVIENTLALHKVILRKREQRHDLVIRQIQEHIKNKTPYPLSLVVEKADFFSPSMPPRLIFVPQQVCEEYKIENQANVFYAVDRDDAILKYYKGISSRPGRDIFGRFIEQSEGNFEELELPNFSREDAMIEDNGDSVWIKSLVSAFVSYKNNEIIFFKQEVLDNVGVHNTPLLLGGKDKQIRLEIGAADPLKDAIESGMIIEAGEIIIRGNVASGVTLKAKNVEIEGQTHQNSKIVADRAKILSHKGTLIAKEVEIGSIEGGIVEGEKIVASYCNGGRVSGGEVKIAEVENNNKVTFNYRLYLTNIAGENNEIIFYSFATEKSRELAEVLTQKKESIAESAKGLVAKYQKLMNFIAHYQKTIDQIKSVDSKAQTQMLQNKKIRDIFQRHSFALEEVKKIKKELMEFESLIKTTAISLTQLDDEVLGAQVSCDGAWGVGTQLCYQRDYPKKMTKFLAVSQEMQGNYQLDKKTREFIIV